MSSIQVTLLRMWDHPTHASVHSSQFKHLSRELSTVLNRSFKHFVLSSKYILSGSWACPLLYFNHFFHVGGQNFNLLKRTERRIPLKVVRRGRRDASSAKRTNFFIHFWSIATYRGYSHPSISPDSFSSISFPVAIYDFWGERRLDTRLIEARGVSWEEVTAPLPVTPCAPQSILVSNLLSPPKS